MLAGELPWDKPVFDCADFLTWSRDNNCQKSPWCKIENMALSLLRNILKFDPLQRFTVQQIKQSTWYLKAHKMNAYEQMPHQVANNFGNSDAGFLSQPTYFLINSTKNSTGTNEINEMAADSSMQTINMMSSELEVTDSQQDCECSQQQSMMTTTAASAGARVSNQRHAIESFSQPISIEHMYLNSQAMPTQLTQTQVSAYKLLIRTESGLKSK